MTNSLRGGHPPDPPGRRWARQCRILARRRGRARRRWRGSSSGC